MMKKRLLTGFFAVIMIITTYPVYASPDIDHTDFSVGFDQTFMIPDYSAVPDDYDEYGNPIFYVTVHPDVWAQTFIYHPFFQGLTPYEDATFMLKYDDSDRMQTLNDWCPRCGNRSVITEIRWEAVATRGRVCPGIVVGGGVSLDTDILMGSAWGSRDFCRGCGWASHTFWERWWHDPNENQWSWTIHCNNGRSSLTSVIRGATVWDGQFRAHQAVSTRENSINIVHGHNCISECGVIPGHNSRRN